VPVPVTLNGSNFAAGTTLAVSGSGVSISNVTVVSAAKITATFAISAVAATGARNVTVTASGGTSAAQPFTVTPATTTNPVLSSLAPNSGPRGATLHVAITGSNFTAPATVTVAGGGVTVSDVVVVSPTSITATFRVSRSATRHSRDTTVTTPNGTSNTLPFTVK
jgi:hypothetical protein